MSYCLPKSYHLYLISTYISKDFDTVQIKTEFWLLIHIFRACILKQSLRWHNNAELTTYIYDILKNQRLYICVWMERYHIKYQVFIIYIYLSRNILEPIKHEIVWDNTCQNLLIPNLLTKKNHPDVSRLCES